VHNVFLLAHTNEEHPLAHTHTWAHAGPAPILLLSPLLLWAAVVELCQRFKEQLLNPQHARQGVMPLMAALQRLSPGKQHLTPLHADVLQL
jgi:hypothetical protein